MFLKTSVDLLDKKDPAATVVEIATKADLGIQRKDIRSAVVQPRMSGESSTVVKVEFKDEQDKINLMKSRAKIRTQNKDVALFDVLSRENAELYKSARVLVSKGYAFVYHRNGRVYAKKTADVAPVLIKSKEMVETLSGAGTSSTDFATPNAVSAGIGAGRRSLNLNPLEN